MQAPIQDHSRSPEGGYDLDKLRLRFRDDSVEERFRVESIDESRPLIRIYLIAAALLYLSFGVLDAVVGGPMVGALWFIRYAVVCPVLLAAAALTYVPSFPRFAQTVTSVAMIAPGLGVVTMTAIMPP